MPIVVTCPSCPTKLSAPDEAAGKAVRCPKCGAAATVPALIPAEEVPVVEANLTPPKPKPRPVVAESAEEERPRKASRTDDDDADEEPRKRARRGDDEGEERPRKKKKRHADDDDDYDFDHPRRKRRPNKSGGGGAMVAVAIVGGLVLLVGLGIGIYFLAGKKSPFARKAPVPAGWEQYTNSGAGVKMYVPKKPSETTFPVNGLGRGGGRFGGGFQGGADLQDAEMLSIVRSGVTGDPVRVEVFVLRFRNSVPSSVRDKLFNNPDTPPGAETRKARWLGREAVEQTRGEGVARAVCFDNVVVVAAVSGRGVRASKAEEDGFFDNFELTK
jgi:hypothetical protein